MNCSKLGVSTDEQPKRVKLDKRSEASRCFFMKQTELQALNDQLLRLQSIDIEKLEKNVEQLNQRCLHDQVLEAGGLHIIGTERHESRRIDNQLRARHQKVGELENFSIDGRCEWFWSSRDCPSCGLKNDTTAKECRSCRQLLIDPNLNLKGKHYTDDDFQSVAAMQMRTSKNGNSLVIDYFIDTEPMSLTSDAFSPKIARSSFSSGVS